MTQFYDGYGYPGIPIFRFNLLDGLIEHYLPSKGSERATGWDVKSTENLIIKYGEYVKINLGFRMFAPPGWWAELRPRSSSFAKKNLHALYGVIDEDYEGQVLFACQYLPSNKLDELKIDKGEAIGQIIPVIRYNMIVTGVSNEEYETLCKERDSLRGAGGFGSTTGKKALGS